MANWWGDHDPESASDRAELGKQCYQLKLKGHDDYQIAERLGISPAEVGTWSRTGEKAAPVEDTDNDIEIARVNGWALRLEEIWEACSVYDLDTRSDLIHRFIVSFDKLSRRRSALGGLDRAAKPVTAGVASGPPASLDEELQRLAQELGVNDKKGTNS